MQNSAADIVAGRKQKCVSQLSEVFSVEDSGRMLAAPMEQGFEA